MAATFLGSEKHSRAMSQTKTRFEVRAMSHSEVFAAIAPDVIYYMVMHHGVWYMDQHYHIGKSPFCLDVKIKGECGCCRAREVMDDDACPFCCSAWCLGMVSRFLSVCVVENGKVQHYRNPGWIAEELEDKQARRVAREERDAKGYGGRRTGGSEREGRLTGRWITSFRRQWFGTSSLNSPPPGLSLGLPPADSHQPGALHGPPDVPGPGGRWVWKVSFEDSPPVAVEDTYVCNEEASNPWRQWQ